MMLPTHEPELANPASIDLSLGGAQHDQIELILGQKTPLLTNKELKIK